MISVTTIHPVCGGTFAVIGWFTTDEPPSVVEEVLRCRRCRYVTSTCDTEDYETVFNGMLNEHNVETR